MSLINDAKNLFVVDDRTSIKNYIASDVSYWTKTGIVPTLEQVVEDLFDNDDFIAVPYDEAKRNANKEWLEMISVYDFAKNIQNLVSFNTRDDFDESRKVKNKMKLMIKESYSNLADNIAEVVGLQGFWTRENEFIDSMNSIGADVEDINYEYADVRTDDEECTVYFNRGGRSFTVSKIKCYDEDGNSFWYEELDESLVREGFSVDDDLQDIWEFVQEQKYDSAETSLNQLAGGVKAVAEILPAGSLNLDYGGGRYNQAVEYLKQVDVMNLVFDPFNRTKEHNKEVLDIIKEYGGADSCTCCNVLNVIDGESAKITALKNIKRLVKSGGKVYIQTYEGSDKIETQNDKGKTVKKPSGIGKPTKKGWQENKETKAYIPLVKKVFPDAMYKVIKGVPMIVCMA